ncbi:hypothetical protein D3C75_964110 [compost metagenome]
MVGRITSGSGFSQMRTGHSEGRDQTADMTFTIIPDVILGRCIAGKPHGVGMRLDDMISLQKSLHDDFPVRPHLLVDMKCSEALLSRAVFKVFWQHPQNTFKRRSI